MVEGYSQQCAVPAVSPKYFFQWPGSSHLLNQMWFLWPLQPLVEGVLLTPCTPLAIWSSGAYFSEPSPQRWPRL